MHPIWFLALFALAAILFVLLRILLYTMARFGQFWALVPTNSALPIEVGRNLDRVVVTPPDEDTYQYFLGIQQDSEKKPWGKLYRVRRPGFSGFIWKGLPFVADSPEWSDTEELQFAIDPLRRALPLQERVLIYPFQPETKELEKIRTAVEQARETGQRTISSEQVRKLSFTPNQKTRDMIDVKVELAVYIRSVDPVLSFTRIRFPQDMVRGMIVPALRRVMADLELYRPTTQVEEGTSGDGAGSASAQTEEEFRRILINRVQRNLRYHLGILRGRFDQSSSNVFEYSWENFAENDKERKLLEKTLRNRLKKENKEASAAAIKEKMTLCTYQPYKSEWKLVNKEEGGNSGKVLDKRYLPEEGSIARLIMDDWGYLIRDVLVQDLQEAEGIITDALAEVAKEKAQATARVVRAEADRKSKIIEAEGERRKRELEGLGTQQALRAQILAFTPEEKISPEAVAEFQMWFSREILGRNVAESARTFFYQWPSGHGSNPLFDALQGLVAANPDLLNDPSKLGSAVRTMLDNVKMRTR